MAPLQLVVHNAKSGTIVKMGHTLRLMEIHPMIEHVRIAALVPIPIHRIKINALYVVPILFKIQPGKALAKIAPLVNSLK